MEQVGGAGVVGPAKQVRVVAVSRVLMPVVFEPAAMLDSPAIAGGREVRIVIVMAMPDAVRGPCARHDCRWP